MSLIKTMRVGLKLRVDPIYRSQIKVLVPGIRTVGVRVPRLRQLAAELTKPRPPLEDAVELFDAAAEAAVRDEFLVAVFVLQKLQKPLLTLPWVKIAHWLSAADNWESVDQLAGCVAAPWLVADLTRAQHFLSLTQSKRVWDRRFSLSVGAALNQRGRSNPGITLTFCEPLLEDPEPMVRKALAWAIREASEKDEPAAFAFLKKHRARMHRTVLRESAEQLTPKHRVALAG